MNKYKIFIKSARPLTVNAETESEAFDIAFDDMEWDYDVELVDENVNEEEGIEWGDDEGD